MMSRLIALLIVLLLSVQTACAPQGGFNDAGTAEQGQGDKFVESVPQGFFALVVALFVALGFGLKEAAEQAWGWIQDRLSGRSTDNLIKSAQEELESELRRANSANQGSDFCKHLSKGDNQFRLPMLGYFNLDKSPAPNSTNAEIEGCDEDHSHVARQCTTLFVDLINGGYKLVKCVCLLSAASFRYRWYCPPPGAVGY